MFLYLSRSSPDNGDRIRGLLNPGGSGEFIKTGSRWIPFGS